MIAPAAALPPTLALPERHPWGGRLVRLAPALLPLADALVIGAVLLACYEARFVHGWLPPRAPAPPWGPYVHAAGLVAFVWTACLAWVGMYRPDRPPSRYDDAVLLVAGLATGAGATLALSFFYRSFSYSRLVAAYAFAGSLGVLLVGHWLARSLQLAALRRGCGARPTLVLGDNALGQDLARRLGQPQAHRLVGVVALAGDPPSEPGAPGRRLGEEADLDRLIATHGVESLLIAWPDAPPALLAERLGAWAARWPGLELALAPDLTAWMTARLTLGSLDGLPVLTIREVPLRRWQNRALKRAVDLALAGFGLLAAAPLLALIALLVWGQDRGPVLYVQERLGRDGHPFSIYKFRTMPVDAEPDGPVWARPDDERPTRLGHLLRRYSLDELPQLWNVLRGEMSLVGPRPERPYFVDRFRTEVPKYMDRHLVRCGLTGWAQVNGLRGDVSIDARTRHDIWYVENWSLLLDVRILLMTLAAIVRRPAH